MAQQANIKKNYIYNTLYQILNFITPFITAPYTARVFGPEGIGIQSYTGAVVTFFTLLASLGLASYGQREIARNRDDKEKLSQTFWEIEIISVISTSIVLVAWAIWIYFNADFRIYYIILTASIVNVVFNITWFFGGLENFKFIVIRNTIIKLVSILALFIFVRDKDDLALFIAICTFSVLLTSISLWFYLPKLVYKIKWKEVKLKEHYKQTIAYFIPAVATTIYTVLDKYMLKNILNSVEENGYYEESMKLIRIIQSVLFSLNTVMNARMSNLFAKQAYDEIRDKLNKSFDYLLMLAIPCYFGLAGISRTFIPVFLGEGYEKVIMLNYVLGLLPMVITISNILGEQYLTPSGQRVRSSKAIVTGACTNFLLNLILIPILASVGAAIASVIAELVISILYVRMSKEYVSWKMIFSKSWKRLIAAITMFLIIFFGQNLLKSSLISVLLLIISGGLIYSLMLFIMKDKLFINTSKQISIKIRNKLNINNK